MIPNFHILGAPKSGTSAMCAYLDDHPNVFMSDPKETMFWASDYPGIQKQMPGLKTMDDYLKLFSNCTEEHSIVGEATTYYLMSSVAVRHILEFNPDSRFLVMLRNPIDFAPAFHNEKRFDRIEDVADFNTAWDLQQERAAGHHIPPSCCQPEFLQYGNVGAFGSQVTQLKKLVDPDKLEIILFDDFTADTRATYVQILNFLDLQDDGRTEFPRVNERKAPRFQSLNALYHTNNSLLRHIVHGVRSRARHIAPLRNLWKAVESKPREKTKLSAQTRSKLVEYFEDEIRLLSDSLGRDLSHWLDPDPNAVECPETTQITGTRACET